MTLAIVGVVCATLLFLQREGLRYLREYHGTSARQRNVQAALLAHGEALKVLQDKLPTGERLDALERRLKDVETLLQAQKITRR